MKFHIEFITPLFSRGSYEDRPEVRPSSIRGQLHWWFRALGGSWEAEKQVFGGVHNGARASKVVIRVANVSTPQKIVSVATLPHKTGGQASPKAAFGIGTSFDLGITHRLGGPGAHEPLFQRTVEAWLLLGTLGLRATRAGGSFRWATKGDCPFDCPNSLDAYESRCRDLLQNARVQAAILQTPYDNAEVARRVVSDTLGGRADKDGDKKLALLHYPLGRVFGGRKTSPLRFRIIAFGKAFHIAAIWDGRTEVTGNTDAHLHGIIKLLAERKPALGKQLAASSLAH